jgi:hypothetical protein
LCVRRLITLRSSAMNRLVQYARIFSRQETRPIVRTSECENQPQDLEYPRALHVSQTSASSAMSGRS